MFFNEDHLRVTKVKTTDGINPFYDSENRVVKKVIELPLTSKKLIEQQNDLLPNQLKMKIEVIKAYNPAPLPNEVDLLKAKIAELELDKIRLENNLPDENNIQPVKKMGRPKKVKENEPA
jgi:hypothetical protein